MKRLVALLAVAALAAIAGASPVGGSAGGARGGTVRVAIYPLPRSFAVTLGTLDPQQIGQYDEWELMRCCLVRTLMSYMGVPAEHGGTELRPDLATAFPSVSPDGLTWTFRLRRGLRYAPPLAHVKITAGDIVRALERAAPLVGAPPAGTPAALSAIQGFDAYARGRAGTISGLEVPDPHTLVVRLRHQQGDLPREFAFPETAPLPASPLRPARLSVATGHDHDYGRYLVASGPYMIDGSEQLRPDLPVAEQRPVAGYVPRRSVTLVRNPSWNGATDALRPALADRLEIRRVSDRAAAARAVDSGRADLAIQPVPSVAPPAQVRRYRTHPELGRVEARPQLHVRWIEIRVAEPPFDDIHVRRALAWAIDRRAYLEGYTSPGRVFGHVAADALEGGLLRGFDPFRTPGERGSLAKARAEMRLSRYDTNHDGRCDAPACLDIPVIPTNSSRANQVVVRDAARIGLQLRLLPSGARAFQRNFFQPARHTALELGLGVNGSVGDPIDLFNAFSSTKIRTFNFWLLGARSAQLRAWGYPARSVPSVDTRLARCRTLPGDAGIRCAALLDEYLMQRVVPVVPLVNELTVQVIPRRVVAYSYDQSNEMPALDRVAVAGR